MSFKPWNLRVPSKPQQPLPPEESLAYRPRRPLDDPHPRWPYENLAFEGGGAKAIAYVGALEVLEDLHLYPERTRRVVGASSGSFLAAMVAVGVPAHELARIVHETNLATVMRDARFGWLSGLANLLTVFGLHPGERLLDFLGEHLRERTGSADVTFAQVLERCGRELCVPVTNLTRRNTEYCHPKTTPDLPVRVAVGMSMSLPFLMVPYRLVREHAGGRDVDLYTDGGLMCNFPIHAFDGWWLSMRREDTFLRRLRPLDRAVELAHDSARFQPRNPATLGLTVFDRTEGDASEAWLSAAAAPPPRPDTALARSRSSSERRLAQTCEQRARVDAAAGRLVDAISAVDTSGDGWVDAVEIDRVLHAGLTEEDARLLFGTADTAAIFAALDRDRDGHVGFSDLNRFVDARHVELTARLGLTSSLPTSMGGFVTSLFSTLLTHVRQATLRPDDRSRTLPIDTDYVSTADFDLEPADREFLLETGRRAARAFLS